MGFARLFMGFAQPPQRIARDPFSVTVLRDGPPPVPDGLHRQVLRPHRARASSQRCLAEPGKTLNVCRTFTDTQ